MQAYLFLVYAWRSIRVALSFRCVSVVDVVRMVLDCGLRGRASKIDFCNLAT